MALILILKFDLDMVKMKSLREVVQKSKVIAWTDKHTEKNRHTETHTDIHWHDWKHYLTAFASGNKIDRHMFILGLLIPLFWTSEDVSSGFQSTEYRVGSIVHTWWRHMIYVPWDSPVVRHLCRCIHMAGIAAGRFPHIRFHHLTSSYRLYPLSTMCWVSSSSSMCLNLIQ